MIKNSVKFLLRFFDSSLYEEVGRSYSHVEGEDLTVLIGEGSGYSMKEGQYIYNNGILGNGNNVDIDDKFSLSFFLMPTRWGTVVNPSTGVSGSLTLPIIEVESVSGSGIAGVKINEICTVDEDIFLGISFGDGEYYFRSDVSCDKDLWHHIILIYDGSTSSCDLYIDGNLSGKSEESGSIPNILNIQYANIYINHSLEGYDYNIAKNEGHISDIFLENVSDCDITDIAMIINHGVSFYVDSDFDEYSVEGDSFLFNDAATLTINSSVDDMSYIYLARNDGVIMQGSQLFWKSRHVFSDEDEINFLGLSGSDLENGFLKLSDQNVRL